MAEKIASLQFENTWPAPDLHKLHEFIQNQILPFIGEDYHLWGTFEQTGELSIKHKIGTLAEIEPLLSIEFVRMNININAGYPKEREFHFSFEENTHQIWGSFNFEIEALEIVQILQRALEEQLVLEPALAQDYAKPALSSSERRYYFPQKQKPDILLEITTWMISQFSSKLDYFDGEINSAGVRTPVANLDGWTSIVQQEWKNIQDVRLSLETRHLEFRVRGEFENETLILEIKTLEKTEILALFDEFERQFQLEDVSKGVERIGERRKYFSKRSLDLDWIKKAVDIIQNKFKSKRYFVGRYALQQNPSQEISHEDLDDWQAVVLRQWEQIIWISLWFDQKFLKVDCHIDLNRELIELNIDAIDQAHVEGMFQYLENNLELDLAQEDPYQYRSASATYEVTGWRNERFAQAVQDAIDLFVGKKFSLVVAYVELGPEKNQKFIPFHSLQEFLKRAGSAEPYANAQIHVQGPHGYDLFVEAYENHQKLYIGTTTEAQEASDLKAIFEKALKLKEISVKDKSEEAEKPKQKQFQFDLIKIVVTALIAFLLSSLFWANIFPKNSIQITVPRSVDGQTVVINSTDIPVEWILETEQWFQRKNNRKALATVRVLEDGLNLVEQKENQLPPLILELDPGIYDIEVIHGNSGAADIIRIEIREP